VNARLIEFRFKGNRDYIQGPDIYNAIMGAHRPDTVSNVHFVIHDFVRTTRCEVFQAESQRDLREIRDIKVRAKFEVSGVTQWVALKSAAASGPFGRYEYSEDRITSLCNVEPRGIVLDGESPYTFIETVVAMNKHMHRTLFTDAVGQWLFTGIDLLRGCNARERIALRCGRDVNYRLTRTEIVHDGQPIGNIFFSLAQQ